MPVKSKEYSPDIAARFIEALDSLKGDYTVAEIHSTLGVSAPYVSTIRAGNRMPTLDHLAALTIHFGISGQWLLTGKGEKELPKDQPEIEKRLKAIESRLKSIESHLI
ncbi:helix-turn-helix domain-containing protein [Chitinophaga sp. Hz27]|uniref:helix-turn-helix domain-containing protein n=1 Tax=Chitinophaga sp. Hz27 TaxID=3347169 RepID=UPI0035D93AA9